MKRFGYVMNAIRKSKHLDTNLSGRKDDMTKDIFMKKIHAVSGLLALVVVVLLSGIGLTGCGNKTIDLSKYIEIETSGYDGYGTAVATFNSAQFESDYAGKIKVKDKNNSMVKLEKSFGASDIDIFEGMITGELDKAMNISNGDTITYTFKIDSDMSTIFKGYKITGTTVEYTVNNLEKVDSFNPFDSISVKFYGDNDAREIAIEKPTDEMWESINVSTYSIKDEFILNVKAGDKIKLKIECGDMESFIKKYNLKPSEIEKEVTVSRFDSYITAISQIDSESQKDIQEKGKNFLVNDLENTGKAKNVKVEYVGEYLLHSTDGKPFSSGWNSNIMNYYYVTYKVSADIVYNNVSYGSLSYYDVIKVKNVEKGSDGKCGYSTTYIDTLAGHDVTSQLESVPGLFTMKGFDSFEEIEEKLGKESSSDNVAVDKKLK